MREISTKKIEIGEHVLIDGVEYVAEEHGGDCASCDLYNSLHCHMHCYIPCGEGVMVKVDKPAEIQDKDTPMTNLQLAEWLAKGNGQYRLKGESTEGSFWMVYEDEEDLAVDSALIRPWGTDEWIKPTVAIYERDCR